VNDPHVTYASLALV